MTVTARPMQAIILGSSRGIRRLDAARSMPASLQPIKPSETVLDWTLHALRSQGIHNVTFIGGYQIQKVIERHPSLSCRYHATWQDEDELGALLTCKPHDESDCFVLRSSTLLLPGALEQLANTGVDAAAGYHSTAAGEEYLGLIFLERNRLAPALSVVERLVKEHRRSNLNHWVDALAGEGLQLRRVNLEGLAAPIREPEALARTLFGSKARTLAQLKPLMKTARVPEQIAFNVAEWRREPESILTAVARNFGAGRVVVRSSALAEDGLDESFAGRFRSVLDVPGDQESLLTEAVEKVIQSYNSQGRIASITDEVFVQPQIGTLAASGVLLTRDLDTGAPYYVLNIDRTSGQSNTVTSGAPAEFDTWYVSRRVAAGGLPPDPAAFVSIGRELEELMHLDALDIELGIDHSGEAHLFQVRPISIRARTFELADEDLIEELECVREFLDGHMSPHPHLHGATTIFSTMSDWNPAEMIGTTPRPLALSLYQRLIGNSAWAESRASIGYRDAGPEPLIIALGGRAYVDVRASLNSLLPADLDHATAEKWVDYGLNKLRETPALHDKTEFEVAIPCLDFNTDQQLQRLTEAGLSQDQISRFRGKLLALTDQILLNQAAPIDRQLDMIAQLEPRRSQTLLREESNPALLARQIHYLLNDCEKLGLVPFSVLARYAFIAVALVRSLGEANLFTEQECETVFRSIPSIATQMSQDLARVGSGQLTRDDFLQLYGHVRPSSYDITSPNYASAPQLYLAREGRATKEHVEPAQSLLDELFESRTDAIDQLLIKHGFQARTKHLREFVRRAIPGREWAKFQFMKNLDAALERTAALGELLGIGREEMSFLSVERLLRGATDSASAATATQLMREIGFAKKRWQLTCSIRLPHLVTSSKDVDSFQVEVWSPNFVSRQHVIAPPVVLDDGGSPQGLDGKIVMIRAADPGYDWIFGHAIAGLVTQYGGVASHMAIRAAEFGLPAAIGCGEAIFERLREGRLLDLDCANKRVNPVQ